jgi:hypothetical protein
MSPDMKGVLVGVALLCITALTCVVIHSLPASEEAKVNREKFEFTKNLVQQQTFSLSR